MTEPRWPVIEVFGPTVQGEGAEAGLPCYFIRFGGCDYRCKWCDSMYAVEPAEVRANAQSLGVADLISLLTGLEGNPEWIVLSGGNPALLELGTLVHNLQVAEFKVAVETQGSRWRPWLAGVDRLTVSPKPPSSGMATAGHALALSRFLTAANDAGVEPALKIVVADAEDLEWAKGILTTYRAAEKHLSVCTPQPGEGHWESTAALEHQPPESILRLEVADRYRWLCEQVAADPDLAGVRVLPQLHVIAWGSARGV